MSYTKCYAPDLHTSWQAFSTLSIKLKERFMAKGQDSKKADKKKPEKTLKEKRAEKKEKKANK